MRCCREEDDRLQCAENNWVRRQLRTHMRASIFSKYGHTRLSHTFIEYLKPRTCAMLLGMWERAPKEMPWPTPPTRWRSFAHTTVIEDSMFKSNLTGCLWADAIPFFNLIPNMHAASPNFCFFWYGLLWLRYVI